MFSPQTAGGVGLTQSKPALVDMARRTPEEVDVLTPSDVRTTGRTPVFCTSAASASGTFLAFVEGKTLPAIEVLEARAG